MATKKINTDLQLTAKLLDGSGSAGTSGQILSSTGTATDWISLSEISGVDGAGTANYIAKWSDADTIGNSIIYDNGTNVYVGGTSTTNSQGWGRQIASINSGTNGAALTLKDGNGEWQLATYYDNFYLTKGATTTMLIDSNGNVGIGTTSPADKLSVIGTVNASSILASNPSNVSFTEGAGATNGQIYLYPTRGNRSLSVTTQQIAAGDDIDGVAFNAFYTNTGGALDLLFRNGGNNNLYIKANGRVGIGTINPGSELEVNGDIRLKNYGRLYLWKDNSSNYIDYNNWITSTGATQTIQNTGSGGITLKTGTSARMFINSSGNVGIGTTTPAKKLHVNGTSQFDSDVYQYGVNYGLYHGTIEDDYYFDDYNGSRHLSLFYKNAYADILRYQPIDNLEYWDGSAWQDMSSQAGNVKRLLDGRKDTNWYVPSTYYKFRFTTNLATSWPTRAMIWLETSWTGSTYPGGTVTIEEDVSGTWTTRVTADFNSSNGVTTWGLMARADSALHTGVGSSSNSTRITVDFYGWSPSNPSYVTLPLQNIMITSQFSGSANTDYSALLDYDKTLTAPGKLYITTTDTNTSSTSALVLNGNEVEKRTLGSNAFNSTNFWHSGNDGSGSGLDADLLDGVQGSSYLRSDANDTATGNLTFSGETTFTGSIGNSTTVVPSVRVGLSSGNDPQIQFTDSGYNAHIDFGASSGDDYNVRIIHSASNTLNILGAGSDGLKVNSQTVWNAGNDGSGSGLDADLLDGQHGSYYLPTTGTAANSQLLDNLDSTRFPYALNGTLGTTNTFVTDGGIGADNIARSMFYRDNGDQFGTIGFHAAHATNANYAWQMASTSYSDASSIKARVKNNGTWSSPVIIWNSGNDGAGSGLDADLLDGQHGSYYAAASSLGNYLPLSGGTIDGTLVIDTDTGAAPLTITRLGSASQSLKIWVDDSFAFFQHEQDEDTGVYGSFRFIGDAGGANPVFQWYHGATQRASLDLGNGNLTLTGTLTASGYNDSNWNTAYSWGDHSGLYAAASHTHDDRYYTETESDNRFVNVTGDTMTGTLNTQLVAPTANVTYNLGSSTNHWLEAFMYSVRSGGVLQFKTNGDNERMRITSSGNVGIGTTNPGVKLQVGQDTSGLTGTASIFHEGGSEVGLYVKARVNRASLLVADNDTGVYISAEGGMGSFGRTQGVSTANINIDGSGNVGIGTTTPGSELEVNGEITTTTITYPEPGALDSSAYNGEIVYFGSEISMAAGNLMVLSTSVAGLTWYQAKDSTDSLATGMLGIALGTTASAGLLVRGIAKNSAWSSFSAGDKLYLSPTGGAISNSITVDTNDFVRIVGYALGNSKIYFCPDNTYIKNA